MTEREALKFALEGLEKWGWGDDPRGAKKYITAIEEALAQPEYQSTADKSKLEKVPAKGTLLAQLEQKPVVWMYQDKSTHEVRFQKHMRDFVDHGQTYETPLYTTPPQRTWVGLTDEEKQEWIDAMPYDPEPRHCMILVNVIEAKLKEKNT